MDVSLQVAPAVAAPAAFWFLNSLVTIVADAALSGGSLAIYRQVAPPGFATPYHTHEAYGEGFYVLEGEVTLSVTERRASWAGMVFFFPGAQPHGFRVSGAGPATMLIVSPPESTFGAFVKEMGEPADSLELPSPSQPDYARLASLGAKYGSTIVGWLPI